MTETVLVVDDDPDVAGFVEVGQSVVQHYGDAVAVASEMKAVAKRTPGSSFAVDRRTS